MPATRPERVSGDDAGERSGERRRALDPGVTSAVRKPGSTSSSHEGRTPLTAEPPLQQRCARPLHPRDHACPTAPDPGQRPTPTCCTDPSTQLASLHPCRSHLLPALVPAAHSAPLHALELRPERLRCAPLTCSSLLVLTREWDQVGGTLFAPDLVPRPTPSRIAGGQRGAAQAHRDSGSRVATPTPEGPRAGPPTTARHPEPASRGLVGEVAVSLTSRPVPAASRLRRRVAAAARRWRRCPQ